MPAVRNTHVSHSVLSWVNRSLRHDNKFLDNKISTFKILLSWRFPRKTAFLDNSPLYPHAPTPLKSANSIFIVVSQSLSKDTHDTHKLNIACHVPAAQPWGTPLKFQNCISENMVQGGYSYRWGGLLVTKKSNIQEIENYFSWGGGGLSYREGVWVTGMVKKLIDSI